MKKKKTRSVFAIERIQNGEKKKYSIMWWLLPGGQCMTWYANSIIGAPQSLMYRRNGKRWMLIREVQLGCSKCVWCSKHCLFSSYKKNSVEIVLISVAKF